ncbi:MAG TPA: hypothetical protein VK177_02230 [Flavobacteriales bacterium]|nr:hypothetical protein [Flavobacteriales bacterium]
MRKFIFLLLFISCQKNNTATLEGPAWPFLKANFAAFMLTHHSCNKASDRAPRKPIPLEIDTKGKPYLTFVTYNQLSDTFKFVVKSYRQLYKGESGNYAPIDSLILFIYSKYSHQLIKVIKTDVGVIFDDYYSSAKSRSYSTGYNQNQQVLENYYGDLVVADLNFDGKEDVAFLYERANGGEIYEYYVQTGTTFKREPYLSDSITYFPHSINAQNKTLTTLTRSGAFYIAEATYRLKKNKWTQINYIEHDVRDDKN